MKTFTDLSEALTKKDKVQVLDLSNQSLNRVPIEIGQLTNLTYLQLGKNQIKEIPAEILRLINLTYLCL